MQSTLCLMLWPGHNPDDESNCTIRHHRRLPTKQSNSVFPTRRITGPPNAVLVLYFNALPSILATKINQTRHTVSHLMQSPLPDAELLNASRQGSVSPSTNSDSPNLESEAGSATRAFQLPTTGRFLLLATVAWCAIPLSPQQVDSDFWGHVQYGRDTWHYGLANTSTYSFTSLGYPWINHENLAELIFAAATEFAGVWSVLALKCVLGVSVLALAVWRANRRNVGPLTTAAVCVLVSINLSFYWGVRPHVFSFAFFGWMIAFLDFCFERWSQRRPVTAAPKADNPTQRLWMLWFVPILLMVWANTHGGFLAGTAVFATMMGSRAIEVLVLRVTAVERRWRTALTLVLIAAAGCAATLINPYGLGLHRWLFQSLGSPRPEILEWHPTRWFASSSLKLWAMVLTAGFAFLATKKRRDLTHLLIIALVTLQACKHQRHWPFVAILLLFWLPVHLHSATTRFLDMRSFAVAKMAPLMRLASCFLLAISCLFAYRVGNRLATIPVPGDDYPISAVQYMSDQSLNGRLVVSGHWAQYLIGTLGARTPQDQGVQVAFDGRFRTCYPQQAVDLHFDFFLGDGGPDKRYRSPTSPPIDGKRILEFHAPQLVLLNRRQTQAAKIMTEVTNDWVLLYQDSLAQLWGRRSIYDDPQHASYIPLTLRRLDGEISGTVPFPAAPKRS